MDALLETFGIDWHLLFAQAVNFAILVGLLTWLLYKPVLKMVREREEVIAKGVEDAERAAEKLAGADSAAASIVKGAETEAEKIMGGARDEAGSERARILKEAEMRATVVAKDAEARAHEYAAQTLRESEKEIARLSILAAEKVLQKKT